jgi:hydrogenase maturation factor HypF (carbamoyltransferase family)
VLTERAFAALRENGFDVRLMHQVPCNDAGISYGQIIETGAKLA